jgi:thiol-disulfide isomerase/thioredoxin
MKKVTFAVLALLLSLVSVGQASQRVVVAEDFTSIKCQYCPAAANGLDQLYNEAPDSIVVLAYHSDGLGPDPYTTAETTNRTIFYSDLIPGYPTVIFDGLDSMVGSSGSGAAYSNYDYYRPIFDAHKIVSVPFEIMISLVSCDLTARTGTAEIKIKNTGASTESGLFHFVIAERRIPYPQGWYGMYEVDFVVRDMVPDENGEAVNIPAGDSAIVTRNFAIDSAWALGSCQYVAFIQQASKEIVQGAELKCRQSLIQKSCSVTEFGNGNGFYEPAETLKCAVHVQELFADGTGARVTAWTPDTFVTIPNGVWDIGNIAAEDSTDNGADPFQIIIKPSAVTNYGSPVTVYLTKQVYNDLYADTISQTDSINFVVGTPITIYTEGFEGGRSNWADSGVGGGVDWDTTTADAHTGVVCITDSKSGNYANLQSRYIWTINGIDLTGMSSAMISWYEKYEVLTNDYCRPELSVNGGVTYLPLITAYNSTVLSWQKRLIDITSYCNADDFKLRFRLTSNSADVADGWYVDDISITGYLKTGVEGNPCEAMVQAKPLLFNCVPNPFNSSTEIRYQLGRTQRVRLSVYDITGRLVRVLVDREQPSGLQRVQWDGRDEESRVASNGVYFYSLETDGAVSTKKLVLVR